MTIVTHNPDFGFYIEDFDITISNVVCGSSIIIATDSYADILQSAEVTNGFLNEILYGYDGSDVLFVVTVSESVNETTTIKLTEEA